MKFIMTTIPMDELKKTDSEISRFKNAKQRAFIRQLLACSDLAEELEERDYAEIATVIREIGAVKLAETIEEICRFPIAKVIVPVKERRLSTAELSDICGVSSQSVRKACESKQIKAIRGTKKSWLIPESELNTNPLCLSWIESKKHRSETLRRARGVLSQNKEFMQELERIQRKREAEMQEE